MGDVAILHEPLFWLLGIPAVVLLGLGKGGFVGVGTLATPLLALAMSPLQAAAIILPLLIVQDSVGVWAFRKTWDPHILKVMLPGVVIGILIAYLFSASLPETWVLGALGLISVLFGLQRLWVQRGGRIAPAKMWPDWAGFACGIGSGVASQIAHAGAPPYQIWVMPRRLPRDMLVGTTAIFFAVMNWMKVPTYVALGEFTTANFIATLALLPVATGSTFAGVWLVRRVEPQRFYGLAYALLTLVGGKLLWDALA